MTGENQGTYAPCIEGSVLGFGRRGGGCKAVFPTQHEKVELGKEKVNWECDWMVTVRDEVAVSNAVVSEDGEAFLWHMGKSSG